MSDTASVIEAPVSAPSAGSWFSVLLASVTAVRAPIAMSLVILFVFWMPQQMWEVYRILAQYADAGTGFAPGFQQWQLVFAAVSILALSLVLWQVARELAHEAAAGRPELNRHAVSRAVLDWSPRLLSATPFAGAALGLWYSWYGLQPVFGPETPELPVYLAGISREAEVLRAKLESGIWIAAGLAAAVFLAITLFERVFLKVASGRPLPETKGRRFFFIANWFLFPLLGAASIAAFALNPVTLPQTFGVIPIFALWATIVTVLAAAGTLFFDRYGFPLLLIAVAAAITFEIFGLSDNHRVRRLDGEAVRADAGTAIKQWLLSRRDAAAYKAQNRPYPVYIVAAEGGGMYAAYHAAKILARMQDLCSGFAQHVFAISGVSGGGLGGAVFSALAEKYARNSDTNTCRTSFEEKGLFEEKVEKLLSGDFLSPLIWAALFPDSVQRFLPVPIYSLDRALWLEKTFEHAWDLAEGGVNPFKRSFLEMCTAGSTTCVDGAAPALLFNTTNVETGAQMVLSPIFFGYTGRPYSDTLPIEDFDRHSATLPHMPLSTAVGLSARFPWLSPAGWHEFMLTTTLAEKQRKLRMSFVDGGYFEGSGASTAERLADYFHSVVKGNKAELGGLDVDIRIIMITVSYKPVDRFFQMQPKGAKPGELATPVATLVQAWRARSSEVPAEVAFERRPSAVPWNGECPAVSAGAASGADCVPRPLVPTAATAAFNNEVLPLPLGWQLADISRKYLDIYTGRPQNCLEVRDPLSMVKDDVLHNDCFVFRAVETLVPAPQEARDTGEGPQPGSGPGPQ